jgi:hypothetical protein
MKRIFVPALLVVGTAALAGSPGGTSGLLSALPAVPHDAGAAYAQWKDADGALSKGDAFTKIEKQLTDAQAGAMLSGSGGTTNIAQQQAEGAKLKAQYDSPEARARMAHMSPAEAMAMAQQIQAQMGVSSGMMGPTVVSPHDQALLRSIKPYPQGGDIRMKLAHAGEDMGKLETAYRADVAKIDAAQSAEETKLPVCSGEAGEPSERAVDALGLKYSDRRIALAVSYLPRSAAIIGGAHGAVAAETAYADHVMASWSALENPSLRSMNQASARGAETNAIADIASVLTLTEDASKPAAQTVADKNKLTRDAAKARGC